MKDGKPFCERHEPNPAKRRENDDLLAFAADYGRSFYGFIARPDALAHLERLSRGGFGV